MTSGVLLDLFGVMIEPNSTSIPSVVFRSAFTSAMLKQYGANVFPCTTAEKMSTTLVSLSGPYIPWYRNEFRMH